MGVSIPLALLSMGTSAFSAHAQHQAQKKSRAQQAEAHRLSQNRAITARKEGEIEKRRVGRKPDITSLLAREGSRAKRGAGATMLTGSQGASPGLLGRKSSLGGGGGY